VGPRGQSSNCSAPNRNIVITTPPHEKPLSLTEQAVTPCDQATIGNLLKTPFLNTRVGRGPGFEPGASRSRTLRTSYPPVSRRFLQCPPVLNFDGRRVLLFPSVSSWFRECVTHLYSVGVQTRSLPSPAARWLHVPVGIKESRPMIPFAGAAVPDD
jgi:hypothetical protein